MRHALATTILTTFALAAPMEAAMKKTVRFDSHGQTLACDLYLPDTLEAGQTLPAVVVTGAWNEVGDDAPDSVVVSGRDNTVAQGHGGSTILAGSNQTTVQELEVIPAIPQQ